MAILLVRIHGWRPPANHIQTPTNSSAIPFLEPGPEVTLQPGAQLHPFPDVTRNKRKVYCTVTLSCDLMCFSTWLQLAVAAHEDAKHPITNFTMRPLHKGTKVFADKGMTSCAFHARFTHHLKESNMYAGESVHSTRCRKTIELNQICNIKPPSKMCKMLP